MARLSHITLRRSVPLLGSLLLLLSCAGIVASQTTTPARPAPAATPRPTTTVVPPSSSPSSRTAPFELPDSSPRSTTVPPANFVPPPAYDSPINSTPFSSRTFGDPDLEFVRPYAAPIYSDWTPQLLPEGLIYRSYLAGVKESRMATVFNWQNGGGATWDITLGGRIGLFRYGTTNGLRPEGFQVDIEGSGQPRLDLNNNEDLVAADFRAGLPVTYGIGPWQTKLGYYHLSSHAGDEYMTSHPGFQRINYARDCLVLGQSYYVTQSLRLYAEAAWAFYTDVAKPWEFQFGFDYSPLNMPGFFNGTPFVAMNGQLRQELNYSGNFVAQVGQQWRGGVGGQLIRIGLQYYNGMSNEFEFYQNFENKVGFGIWYDY